MSTIQITWADQLLHPEYFCKEALWKITLKP